MKHVLLDEQLNKHYVEDTLISDKTMHYGLEHKGYHRNQSGINKSFMQFDLS